MWGTNDALHFVWKKVSGDLTLAADIAFAGTGGDPHRKACLLIRQDLEKDGVYADAAFHGDGLTSLQYRDTQGARTYEVQANLSKPKRLRLEKRGKYVSLSVSGEPGAPLRATGGSVRLDLVEPFYVGLGVCAHNDAVTETAVFSRVELREGAALSGAGSLRLRSTLETVPLASRDRRVVFTTTNRIEAPNWSRDGGSLYYNSGGQIFRIALTNGSPERVDTGFATRCNGNHGLSPDGLTLAISDVSRGRKSLIYTLPAKGGNPVLVTPEGPAFWHGWSPDGRTLVYTRGEASALDVFTVPASGGPPVCLTMTPGKDDAPDYSADGQYIYFSSDRSGSTQIWRMRTDGSQPEAVTNDDYQNTFPHPSPDGRWLAFLSHKSETKGVPQDQDIVLRLMPIGGGRIELLAKLLGGRGPLDVPSWSPDSRRVAFVSYQYSPE